MINKAHIFADRAHDGQYRKDGKTPYITHPVGVAKIVDAYGGDDSQYIAALLHDVVEDCDVTVEQIHQEFGEDIGQLVAGLTNTSKQLYPDLNRAGRKAVDNERLANESDRVKLIKLADIYYNVCDTDSLDRGFAVKFLGEKRRQADIVRSGNEDLYQKVVQVIEQKLQQFN